MSGKRAKKNRKETKLKQKLQAKILEVVKNYQDTFKQLGK